LVAKSFADPSVEDFRREAHDWIVRTVPGEWRDHREELSYAEETDIRRQWDRELFAAGYAGLAWPERYGGRGAGVIEDFVFNEISAQLDAPEGFGRVGRLLVGPGLIAHGDPVLCDRFLPPMLRGEEVWCQGYSEPDAGSDLASLRTRAVRDGDVYRINGQKVWTSYAQYSHWCMLLARTGAADSRSRGLSLMLVPMRQPGVDVRPLRQISGGDEFNEVFFSDATTTADLLIGAENEGWQVSSTILTHERGVGFGAIALTALLKYVALIRQHCGTRSPVLAARLPDLATRVELLRWQMMRSIENIAQGRHDRKASSVLKVYWSELTQEIIHLAAYANCPVHGDYLRQKLLDHRSGTIVSGTSEVQRNIIGERVLGLPREGR
jgi:alkylation response protein AidB-like acyl-CoA dehydrogenase